MGCTSKIIGIVRNVGNSQPALIELLPKLLQSLLHPRKKFKVQGMDSAQFRDYMITRLFDQPWDHRITYHIAKTSRELDLSDDQTELAIKKITR